jgi:hypothetical protein
MGHSHTPEELNFPTLESILRDLDVTADFRGAIRRVSQKNAPPLDMTVLNLKRLLKHLGFAPSLSITFPNFAYS